jgi:hypothetical protein
MRAIQTKFMKKRFAFLVTVAVLSMPGWAWQTEAADEAAVEVFPYQVRVESGDAEFLPGDSIAIEEVRGTSDVISTGQTYRVTGTYNLASRDEAMLAFYVTATSGSGYSQVEPSQIVRVTKGTGSFVLTKRMNESGYPHLSFYPVGHGSSFGGVYFGQGDRVLRNKGWSYGATASTSSQGTTPAGSGETKTASSGHVADANRALLDYLGEPVEPPADLAPAYTKEAMIQAIQAAASEAGVTLKRVEVEDSEFPLLLGVSHEGDFEKMKANLKKTGIYDYPGSVGSHESNVFTIVPYRTFPHGMAERINHRLMLREQVFYDRFVKGL